MSDIFLDNKNAKIAVIGLGYVGLPLALAFGKKYPTIGYDISKTRIEQLIKAIDVTLEVNTQQLLDSKKCVFTSDKKKLEESNTYIITVPSPIKKSKEPDLRYIISASKLIASYLKQNDVVIYESTVYPGLTEEICIPIIERTSKLIYNKEFFVGYSPERVNPGDKLHRLEDIVKVTSGSNTSCANYVDNLYLSIIKAGTFKAKSIKTAEAAKVIENIQRDVNIALINELSILFKKIGVSTKNVLEAASTKWNFLNFKPGLVGGHCIGVDPYYLTYKAQEVNYEPELILAGRRLNDRMADYVSENLILELIKKNGVKSNFKILLMGITFKENCPDIRNTKAYDIYKYFKKVGITLDVYDPCANSEDVLEQYEILLEKSLKRSNYDAIIIAVAHDVFKKMSYKDIKKLGNDKVLIYDLKYILPDDVNCLRL